MNSQDLTAFRRALRAELIERRLGLGASERAGLDVRIAERLSAAEAAFGALVLGFCWPYKGEFDLRPLAARWCEAGATVALCALTEEGAPMRFRYWSPAVPLVPGAFGIPIPLATDIRVPDLIFVPAVGFDAQGYRLGYGGGYFDRFLADLDPKPIIVGVSYGLLGVPSIRPHTYDVAMDFVVHEEASHAVQNRALVRVTEADFAAGVRALASARGLPRRQPGRSEPIRLSSPVCYANDFPGYFGETAEDDGTPDP
jgi:5,10-methenyltetrahydrofolate synthetase